MKRFAWVCLLCGLGGCATQSTDPASPDVRKRTSATRIDRPPVIADPDFLEQLARTRGFSLGRPTAIRAVPDGSAVLFLRSPPESIVHDLYEFTTATGEERMLLSAADVLRGAEEQISPEELARRERTRTAVRGIVDYRLSDDGSQILATLSGRLFVIDRQSLAVTELQSEHGFPLDARFSPDGQWVSCVREGELFIHRIADGAERRLTTGANERLTHGLAEFVAQEEMGRHEGYWWSPDGRFLAYQQTDTRGVETLFIMDAAHPSREPRGWPYPRPGRTNADVRLGIISIDGGETTWVRWDRQRYPYLATVRWSENAPLTMLVQNRRQTEEVLLAVDPDTGSTRPLLTETDDAWINLDQSMPHWLKDGSAFLWSTERNGSWQIELRGAAGSRITAVTPADFNLKRFVSLDEAHRCVFALGGENPTETHIYRVPLDGGSRAPVRLTHERGIHGAVFSENHDVYVHSYSTLNGRRAHVVRRADGTGIGELRSVALDVPFVPSLELTAVGSDPAFHAALIRPRNFDPDVQYPVIVSVYGGPHAQTVRASPLGYLMQQWIADHGFIVISIDGRGTPSRGRAWERVIKGNLIALPLHDQVAGLQALGRKYPQLDLTRVGIYGWSFGGYFSAMAVMQRPDVFHVGVAGAPVADWLEYDTHYTERYMDLPDENPEGYAAASVLTHAEKLERPLLIIHGTADDNVYFMHALKMSDALFRAGKRHDFLPMAGFTHMVDEPIVTTRLYLRIVQYLRSHLAAG